MSKWKRIKPAYLFAGAFVFILVAVAAYYYLLTNNGSYLTAEKYVRSNNAIARELGEVHSVHLSLLKSNFKEAGPNGSATMSLTVEGAQSKAAVRIDLQKSDYVWSVTAGTLSTPDKPDLMLPVMSGR